MKKNLLKLTLSLLPLTSFGVEHAGPTLTPIAAKYLPFRFQQEQESIPAGVLPLPEDAVINIFKLLESKDLGNSIVVCRRWCFLGMCVLEPRMIQHSKALALYEQGMAEPAPELQRFPLLEAAEILRQLARMGHARADDYEKCGRAFFLPSESMEEEIEALGISDEVDPRRQYFPHAADAWNKAIELKDKNSTIKDLSEASSANEEAGDFTDGEIAAAYYRRAATHALRFRDLRGDKITVEDKKILANIFQKAADGSAEGSEEQRYWDALADELCPEQEAADVDMLDSQSQLQLAARAFEQFQAAEVIIENAKTSWPMVEQKKIQLLQEGIAMLNEALATAKNCSALIPTMIAQSHNLIAGISSELFSLFMNSKEVSAQYILDAATHMREAISLSSDRATVDHYLKAHNYSWVIFVKKIGDEALQKEHANLMVTYAEQIVRSKESSGGQVSAEDYKRVTQAYRAAANAEQDPVKRDEYASHAVAWELMAG